MSPWHLQKSPRIYGTLGSISRPLAVHFFSSANKIKHMCSQLKKKKKKEKLWRDIIRQETSKGAAELVFCWLYCWACSPPLRLACLSSETPLEETAVSSANGYHSEIASRLGMQLVSISLNPIWSYVCCLSLCASVLLCLESLVSLVSSFLLAIGTLHKVRAGLYYWIQHLHNLLNMEKLRWGLPGATS